MLDEQLIKVGDTLDDLKNYLNSLILKPEVTKKDLRCARRKCSKLDSALVALLCEISKFKPDSLS